jgi:hypothetical protein
MPHASTDLPYGVRDVLRLALDCDVCPAVVRAVLRGEPLKSRARQRVYRTLLAKELAGWIAAPTEEP